MIILKDYKLLSQDEHIKLLEIRNSKNIRDASNNNKIISLSEHLKWLENLDNNKKYFAVFYKDDLIGGVNFKFKEKVVYEWGIFFKKVNPIISLKIFCISLNYLFQKFDVLYSEILKQNKKAFEFNTFFGIKPYKEDEKKFYMKITKENWQKRKKDISFCKEKMNF